MKRILLTAAITLASFASCDKMESSSGVSEGKSPVFTGSVEEVSSTKTYADEQYRVLWISDDRVSIFTTTYNQQYRFAGDTGDNGGDFEEVSTGGFHAGNDIKTNYAVYPYSASTKMSYDEKITVTMPSVEAYGEKTFGPGASTMVAVTNGLNDYFLPFKNVCGVIVLKLYGVGTVERVSFRGNNGEKIAGKGVVTMKYGDAPEIRMDDSGSEVITMDCGKGVELSSDVDEAKEFWFCIPPTVLSKGFTFTIEGGGAVIERGVSSSRTVARNVVTMMPALEMDLSPVVDLGLSVDWAKCNLGGKTATDHGLYFQIGDVVGKSYDPAKPFGERMVGDFTSCYSNFLDNGRINPEITTKAENSETRYILKPEYDAANVLTGGKLCMPTFEQMDELLNNTEQEYCENYMNTGVRGVLLKSRKEGYKDKYIFLPMSGRLHANANTVDNESMYDEGIYMSKTHNSNVCVFFMGNTTSGKTMNCYQMETDFREKAFSIRPVRLK